MKFLRSRRGVAAIAALLLILFLWRPGVYRLRNRIAISIGSALGRRVAIDNVRLRLLPRPGFDLEGLVIYDDPAFSAEPMIHAQGVSAAIRLRPLLRGRLEIATLSATEPSINLVRNNEGHWNLASLLERNAQIPAAPTGKPASERRPAFPYLEASNARVNFKIGQTKKSYAFMDADLALWQDSENSWAARIKAEPVRTDFHLTDTGLLQINATWQRAATLQSTPVQITTQWQNGQLGQITKLLSGRDRGWRGGVDFIAKLSGTPEALQIESHATIDDFHRYDIVDRENLRLAAACKGQYNSTTSTLTDVLCESPVGDGTLRLSGTLSLASQPANYDLSLGADKVPLASMVRLLRQAKKQIPSDLIASGLLNAEFRTMHWNQTQKARTPEERVSLAPGVFDRALLPQWTGNGVATDVRLSSNAGKNEVTLGTIPLTLTGPDGSKLAYPSETQPRTTQENEQKFAEAGLRFGPATLGIDNSAPVNAGGWISTARYRFFLRGDMELKDLFHLKDLFGLPGTRPAAEGSAKLDLSISGPWQGFAVPITTGTAQLRNVRAEIRGLNTPIEISSASVSLTPDKVLLQDVFARTGSTHWNGGIRAPRNCASSSAAPSQGAVVTPNCVFEFDLTADQFSTEAIAEWFTPHSAKRPWYRILNSNQPMGPSPLLALQARGNLHVGRFGLEQIVATQIATQVEVDRGKIALIALRGQLLQGTHRGNWTIDESPDTTEPDAIQRTSTQALRYRGTGTLHDISLAQVGALMNDAWIAGTADGNFELEGSGDSFRELLAYADGKLRFVMRNGTLQHIEIPGSPAPLPVHRFVGELDLKNAAWKLSPSKLESRDGIYQVSGTVSPDSEFDFLLTRGDEQSWTLTGTLAKPRIEPANRTEAPNTEASSTETDARTIKP